jgi:protein O-mannosyl-transferase
MAARHRKIYSAGTRRESQGKALSQARSTVGKPPLIAIYVCLLLVAITWLVFGQTIGHDFVNFDDHVYVYENPSITRGLSVDGVIGAFTHTHARNWHPVTTISHMLDCQLYGLKAGGHHFTNVLLHTIAVVLLFLVLKQMTSAFWQSAFVAAVFAVHPLHVESVAWVAERKDVLSAVFFMLTLGAYMRYVRRRSGGRYLGVVVSFALGLMCKPMLVTLPFLLLLLDYWPLKRIRTRDQNTDVRDQRNLLTLIVEKIPLFALSAISCVATLFAQRQGPAAIDQLPFVWRLNNAFVSYATYIWQMFWPARLAVFYPYPNNQLASWQIILAMLFLIAVSLWAILLRRVRPYVLTGWFWYLGMLVPVIGFVQVGEQARADRYTYLPQIGLYILIVWAVAELVPQSRERARRVFFAIAAPTLITALSLCAFVQASHWKNSETLWSHALAVTSDNDVAHNDLGFLFLRRGELDKAISHFKAALNIRSRNVQTHYNLGAALVNNNLGNALARKGLPDEAIAHFQQAVELRPDYANAYYNFGSVLFQQNRIDEAITQWQKALAIQPRDPEVHSNLGRAFSKKGMLKEAIVEYEQALKIAPQDTTALNNLAWILATTSDVSIRDGAKAAKLAQRAVQVSAGDDPNFLRTLAAAYAENNGFPEAIAAAKQAMDIATVQGKPVLAKALESEIAAYRGHVPLRQ